MEETGYINPEVAKMYGIPYSQLTPEQKRILHADSVRRAKLIKEREQDVLKNNRKAFEDEAKMEKVLGQIYRECQKEILADVAETIAKVQKAGGDWSYANQSALTRSRGLFEQIDEQIKKLGQKERLVFTQGLTGIYTDQFLRELYGLGQVQAVKVNFNALNPLMIKKTLDYPWSGAMFSDRLWNDKATLGRNLRVGLTQSMILGEGIPQITERINKNINTSLYNAERVARTETKRVSYCAQSEIWEQNGVKELRYRCANGGDSRTCSYCSNDNNKVFKKGEEPTLPRHPNCRCTYIPVTKDTFEDNELNELTGSIRGAENYEKWRQAEAKKQAEAGKSQNIPAKDDKVKIDPTGEVFTGEMGRKIRKSFDTAGGYTKTWGDYEEKKLQELYAQKKLLTDPQAIKQVDSIIKNHEEYKALLARDDVLLEVGKSGTFKLKVPPSQHIEERIRNSDYYNRYSLVETSYIKYNYDVYEERLGGKYFITMTGVSSKKEREQIYKIADKVFTENPRAIGAKLRVATKECAKLSTARSTNLGFYEPSRHRLTVRNFKSYADIYGTDLEAGRDYFAGTLAHEFAHIAHSKDKRLEAVVATAEEWAKWKALVDPYYSQYRENKIVDVGKEWHRMNYPINAEDHYRDHSKDHFYQELWAESTAVLQEDVSKEKKEAEVAKLIKYFPKVAEFIKAFFGGGV